MADPESLNPHEDEALRNVWKQGWRAYRQGHPPPDEGTFGDPKEKNAWLDGYVCARASAPEG